MSQLPEPRLVRQWSEEVARDPRSPAFLPLARFYQRLGRSEAALRMCLRGLEHHPDNVDAHVLLGALYHAAGEAEKAFDEWDIALRLDPGHAQARREIGLLCLERGDVPAARRHLEQAALAAPDDEQVARALVRIRRISEQVGTGNGAVDRITYLRGLIGGLQAPIQRFVDVARPQVLLLITAEGKLLGQHGFHKGLDAVAIASLAAGIHASARALARLINQDGFDHLYQRGSQRQIFLGPFRTPAEELILIAVLADESRLGLVRVAFSHFSREVNALPVWGLTLPALTAETFEHDLRSGWVELFGSQQ